MKYSVYKVREVHKVREQIPQIPQIPRSELVTWPYHVTYPSSHGSTGVNAYCAVFYSSSVSNRSISTSPFIRSIIPIPSFSSLSLKISSILKLLIQSTVPFNLICWSLLLMFPSLAFIKCACVILTILLLNRVMPSYSCCAEKGFVYVAITLPSSC